MARHLSFELCEQLLGTSEIPDEDNHLKLERLKKILIFVMKEQLTPRQKQMLILYFFEQKNMVEISQALNVNKSTVCRTIHRGIKNLREFLKYYQLR